KAITTRKLNINSSNRTPTGSSPTIRRIGPTHTLTQQHKQLVEAEKRRALTGHSLSLFCISNGISFSAVIVFVACTTLSHSFTYLMDTMRDIYYQCEMQHSVAQIRRLIA